MPDGAARVAIVGAGPTGIACAAELARRGIEAVCYEKAFLLDSLYHFPEEMRWFSTRDLLDIAGVPFGCPEPHPTRLEALAYYRSVAERFGVAVEPETEVRAIRPRAGDGVEVETARRGHVERRPAPAAILATGFFGNPRRLGVPGEDRPLVHRRYVSGYPFHGRDVVVIGGKNSAAEAALDLYRHGARVTLLVRAPQLSDRVKYWIRPDLENRIRAGAIRAFFEARVVEISDESVLFEDPAGRHAAGRGRGLSADRLHAGLRPARAVRDPAGGPVAGPGARRRDARVERARACISPARSSRGPRSGRSSSRTAATMPERSPRRSPEGWRPAAAERER